MVGLGKGGGVIIAEAMDRPDKWARGSCSAACCRCCCAKPPAAGRYLVMSSFLEDEKNRGTATMIVLKRIQILQCSHR